MNGSLAVARLPNNRACTRLATLPLLGMITLIQISVYSQAWPDHVVWGSILIFLLTRGPGALSLDYIIERQLTKQEDKKLWQNDLKRHWSK